MLQRFALSPLGRRFATSYCLRQASASTMSPTASSHEHVTAMNNDENDVADPQQKKLKHANLQAKDPLPRPASPEVPLFRPSAAGVTQLRVKRLTDNAKLPTRASAYAAGLDLYSAQSLIIPAGKRGLVQTDLQVSVPSGCYGRVAPRSGLALKHGLDVGAGVIDADYRGPLGVIVFNLSDEDFAVVAGDRIAQLICEKIEMPEVVECPGGLDDTQRGEKGFGSSGGFNAAAPLRQ